MNPNYPTAHHWYSEYLMAIGRPNESLAEIKCARELDPLSLAINVDVGKMLYFARRYDDAVAQFKKALELDSRYSSALGWLANVYIEQGHYEEAIFLYEQQRQFGHTYWVDAMIGYINAKRGKTDAARQAVAQLLQVTRREPIDPQTIATVYIGLGNKDRAFFWFEKQYEARSTGLTSLKSNPVYDSLRSDPRFDRLIKRVGLPPDY